MLSLWWDMKSVIHFVVFYQNETVNVGKYCSHLKNFTQTSAEEKRPQLVNCKGMNWKDHKLPA